MNLALQGTTMSMFIVYAILLLIILFQLIKMLIELTERYILIGILAVTSPLGFSTMTTKSTSNIFAAWTRMVMSQFIIYLLNLWIIKAFLSTFQRMPTMTAGDGAGIVWLIFMWAFLKVAQKLDQFLGRLGIEVGNVGGSLMEELMVAKMGLKAFSGKGNNFGGGILGALKGNNALGTAMKTAVGGAAAVAGAGMFSRAVGAIGGTIKKSWEGSVLNGLASYNKNEGAAVFKAAKETATSKGAGAFASNMAGAGSWVANGLKQVIGLNARTGRDIAKTMNSGVVGDSGLGREEDLNKLKNPAVAANVLTNLHQGVTDSAATEMLKTLVGDERMGHLTKSMLESGKVKAEAYNGGIKWTYEDSFINEKGEKGIKKYEGIVAVNSNNDATRHVLNMRNQTPGVAADVVKRNGVEITYASKSSIVIDNSQSNKSSILGPDGRPLTKK
ncbi:MAG: hypothetical protein GX892_09830 [Thermoanaerobacteraceae bacterium]|nr:hypothetical protein [Thermoanaerobacteraceae bacterium]